MKLRARYAVLLMAASVTGCTDTELPVQPRTIGSPRFGITPPSLSPTDFPLGSSTDPSNSMSLPTYSDSVIVEVRQSGMLQVTSDPNTAIQPYSGPFDGSGIFVSSVFSACYANVVFRWSVGTNGAGPCTSPPGLLGFKDPWVDTVLVWGSGSVTRGPGVPQFPGDCNGHPCHTYGGGPQQVSVTPLQAGITLQAYPDSIMPGSTVTFFSSIGPLSFKNIATPVKILGWEWTPFSPPGQTVACVQLTPQCNTSVKEDGSMRIRALINGTEQAATASVSTWPLAPPCPAAPLRSYKRISTEYGAVDTSHGDPHTGRDFAQDPGTPIYAARSGIVREVVKGRTTGWRVVIEATDGSNLLDYYYHMLIKPSVVDGQAVTAGVTMLGYVGSTGHSTGDHLHFEEHINNHDGLLWSSRGKTIRTNLVQPCTF
jgi:hypothetical protein